MGLFGGNPYAATLARCEAENRRLRAWLRAWQRMPHSDQVYVCVDCGPGVSVDEDECCVTCGRDALIRPWNSVLAQLAGEAPNG